MNYPPQMVQAIYELAQQHTGLVQYHYNDPAVGAASRKITPVYARMDELTAAARVKIDCGSGCDYCCHYHVHVTPLEVFAIVEHIQTWSEQRKSEFMQKLKQYVDRTRNIGRQQHTTMNIACSFLENQRCSIYALRPLACRRHHSASRAACERTHRNPQSLEAAPQDSYRLIVAGAIETVHAQYLALQKVDRDHYEFHSAVYEALTDDSCRARWNAGGRAFLTVTDISPAQV